MIKLLDFLRKDKITPLFNDRQIPLFIEHHIAKGEELNNVFNQLRKLQKLVYALDRYGEANWKLSSSDIDNLWNNIKKCIIEIGFDIAAANDLLDNMFQYMNIEIQIRNRNLPTELPIDAYYRLKICDVELQRNIIKSKSIRLKEEAYYSAWQTFDLLSEVLDDIEDLREDTTDFNCNRIILSVQLKGEKFAKEEYGNYLENISNIFLMHLNAIQSNEIKKEMLNVFSIKIMRGIKKMDGLDITNFKSKLLTKLKISTFDKNKTNFWGYDKILEPTFQKIRFNSI